MDFDLVVRNTDGATASDRFVADIGAREGVVVARREGARAAA
jgi:hypothetical protein